MTHVVSQSNMDGAGNDLTAEHKRTLSCERSSTRSPVPTA
jgi:hypothetical protein